jgi:predicted phosphodiesterase
MSAIVRTIGVISDTHGLLRPEALRALAGSDLILHAGDIGAPGILTRLEGIAPVRAVLGNTDGGPLGRIAPAVDVVDLTHPRGEPSPGAPGPLAYLLHQLDLLDLDPAASGFLVVVFGHTHRPAIEERDGVTYFNPGAAGPRRFSLPVTVGRLHVEEGRVHAEIVPLHVSGG